MAKITAVFPDVIMDQQTGVDNHRQLVEALDTQKNQLNFGYQEDLKQEMQRFAWFNMRFGC
jgi:hypothetical protein